MISSWPEAGAFLGSVSLVVGVFAKAVSNTQKRDDKVLDTLLKNQIDQTRILDRLSMLIENRDSRTEELHRDTHKKLDDVTENQRDIINIISGFRKGANK